MKTAQSYKLKMIEHLKQKLQANWIGIEMVSFRPGPAVWPNSSCCFANSRQLLSTFQASAPMSSAAVVVDLHPVDNLHNVLGTALMLGRPGRRRAARNATQVASPSHPRRRISNWRRCLNGP